MNIRLTFLCVLLFLHTSLIVSAKDAHALEFGFLAEISSEYTDNYGREREELESETTNSVAGGVVAVENSETLDLLFDLNASKLNYKNNPEDNETVYQLVTNAEWRIVQDTLTFRLDDVFDRVRIDSTEGDTPDNEEDVNVFSAGPELQIALGSTSDFVAEYRYLNNYFEVSDADSEGSLGILRLLHQSSPDSTISLNFEENRLYHKDPEGADDYITKYLYLEYQKETGTNIFVFDIGQSILQTEGSEETSSTTGALRFERTVTPEASWLLGYSRAYANSADVLEDSQVEIDTEAGVVFLIDTAVLAVARENLYRAQAVYFYGAKIEYDQENKIYDKAVGGATIGVREDFTRDMSLELEGTWEYSSYKEFPRQDKETTTVLTYSYEFQRDFFLRLVYEREARESTFSSEEYLANIYRLSLAYDTTDVADRALPRATR